MWVARWQDHLSGKVKYIWLGDTSTAKQQREAKKFDKATALRKRLEPVRAHIQAGLTDPDPRRRMVATAVYLIDNLGMRVGDEKDPDEADTVGATTLRPEHVKLREGGVVEFNFLGKDSVEWHKQLAMPEAVQHSLTELIQNARPPRRANRGDKRHATRDKPQLFPDVDSHDVNAFLSEIMPGLSAKVFRTHHATQKVQETLQASRVRANSPEYAKWLAVNLANLAAAEFCNHTKKAGVNWAARKEEFAVRQGKAAQRVRQAKEQAKAAKAALSQLRKEARAQVAAASLKQHDKKRTAYQKKIERAEHQVVVAQVKADKAEYALGNLKAQAVVASKKRTWNLTTSLKSYVDPRAFYRWGQRVDYDVLGRYYPTTLRRKFSWVRSDHESDAQALVCAPTAQSDAGE
jgi:DNA topoisomerase-1